MKAVIKTLIFIFVISYYPAAYAQTAVQPSDTVKKSTQPPLVTHVVKPKGPPPLRKEVSGGIRLNTNGWSIYSDIGKIKTKDPKHSDMFHNVRIWQIEFTEKKDPRETKSTSTTGNGANTYIYGKINNFYALKLGWGYRKMIAGKPDPGTVSIHWVNAGGLSVGLLKPYYLNVYSEPAAIKYVDPVKGDFLDQVLIEGNAGFSKGLNEIKIVPGGYLRSAMHFDFSNNKKSVIGVETGVNLEFYSQDIPIMAGHPPVPVFADLFIGVQFGKRW